MIQNFEWSLPTKVHFGIGEFSRTGKLVKGMGKRTLIVTSKSFATGTRTSLLDDLKSQLKSVGIEYEIFSEIEANPHTLTIDRAANLAREFKPRFVIALGGGSVMDASKAIAMLAINDGLCTEYVHWGTGTTRKKFNSALPLVCIPTVAATSSETDPYGVITDPVNFKKAAIWGDSLQPAMAIIDPEMTYTVGARQTVDGAFDIITHVIEEFLSAPNGFDFGTKTGKKYFPALPDNLALSIIESVVKALPEALSNPKSENARSTLSWASSIALCGVLRGRDGSFAIHSIEHGLSAATDVAHGRGLAMILPRKMKFDSSQTADRIEFFNKRIFGANTLESGLIPYMKEVGAWTNLSDIQFGFNKSVTNISQMIDFTIEHSLKVDGIFKTGEDPYLENVIPLKAKDIRSILENCT